MLEAESLGFELFRNQNYIFSNLTVFQNPSKLTPVTWYMAANIDINDAHKRFTQKYIGTLNWLISCLTAKFKRFYFKIWSILFLV